MDQRKKEIQAKGDEPEGFSRNPKISTVCHGFSTLFGSPVVRAEGMRI